MKNPDQDKGFSLLGEFFRYQMRDDISGTVDSSGTWGHLALHIASHIDYVRSKLNDPNWDDCEYAIEWYPDGNTGGESTSIEGFTIDDESLTFLLEMYQFGVKPPLLLAMHYGLVSKERIDEAPETRASIEWTKDEFEFQREGHRHFIINDKNRHNV